MSQAPAPVSSTERRAFVVTGVVQGVGFRPFVHRLASEFGLHGFVLNRAGEVLVEAEGEASTLERFAVALRRSAPPLANVAAVHSQRLAARGEFGFAILASEAAASPAPFIAPDVATCERCLGELFAKDDRRFQYPFLNCTDCGPRLTIIEGSPYDRERTTLRDFELCPACRSEYENPRNRRFHAEPNACPTCGPSLQLLGDELGSDLDALQGAVRALRAELIVAIKGIGGFHLACLARSESATRELRRRKGRDHKPFALLVENRERALALCEFDASELALLESPARPIVLGQRREGVAVAHAVAGESPFLGVMLPCNPLQHLLCRALSAEPLVMTSGNASHDPIAFEERDARARLARLSDRMLTHDRPIHLRCDDSVVRNIRGVRSTLRRARGYAPAPTALGQSLRRPALSCGAQDNVTFALGRGDQAFVSHHLGDLSQPSALAAYRSTISHYQALFAVDPQLLVHDLHPDYASTQYAQKLAEQRGLPLIGVQHHHAHVVSCMVEHALHGPVLGVAWDGSGYGADGTIWGGEFLLCDRRQARRVAHFRALPMPGGERAIHEPWRMALAYVLDAGLPAESVAGPADARARSVVGRMLERDFNCPRTSSVGRLFDAVAALCGIAYEAHYEGQAAIELEWAALRAPAACHAYPYDLVQSSAGVWVIDTRPLIRAIVSDLRAGVGVGRVARSFHLTLVDASSDVCRRLRSAHALDRVVLAGGVFANSELVNRAEMQLLSNDFSVFRAHEFPSGDGGLSLGQLAVAAAHDQGAA